MTLSLYDCIELAGACLTLCVMWEAEHDHACREAPNWLQWVRRLCLGAISLLLLNAIIEDNSQFSLILLVWAGITKMGINATTLFIRRDRPPHIGRDIRHENRRAVQRVPLVTRFGRPAE
jgi:hypothetical protein